MGRSPLKATMAGPQARRPSHLLAGLLVAVALVFLPANTTSPKDPVELSSDIGDTPEFLEVTEEPAAAKAPPQDDSADQADNQGSDQENPSSDGKQQTLETIEKLMRSPIIDPRREASYKTAAKTMRNAEDGVKADLMKVVQMHMLMDRMDEALTKKSMGMDVNFDAWAYTAGQQVAEGAQSSGVECADSHPGLCETVQTAGNCGIKEYADACPLSCHNCAMPASFRMGINDDERAQKAAEERGGKREAAATHEKFQKKELKLTNKLNKKRAKLNMAEHKVEVGEKKAEKTKQKLEAMRAASEKEEKIAKKGTLKAKAKAKDAKERMGKDKKNAPKLVKPDDSAVKGAKSAEKETAAKLKGRKKELKRLGEKKKKDEKGVKDLEKKQSKVRGARENVKTQRADMEEQKGEAEKAQKLAQRLNGKEKKDIKKLIELATEKEKAFDAHIKKRMVVLKKKMKKTMAAEAITRATREKTELLSKAEKKRLADMTVPGEEKKIKLEVLRATNDVMKLREKFKADAHHYEHLGLKWKIPPTLEHQYAKAKLAQSRQKAQSRN